MTAIVFEVGEETNENLFVRSSSRFVVGIAASERSVPRSVPLCDSTGNHMQVVLYEPEMLTSMRLVKVFFGDSYR